ncbi:hypothetical protein NSE_0928 [Neorickettsia sennetsu str. Miyayama]|uniref:Uncharacterized protein n=1 Tax=Ehrlichia sennetsu (strain ATCC VR-367 / Miyayama) TaxID=222891 RepID=Q2GCK4_EHRS3|nr:hypothetical protein NSE_0928 [Neorickettsia sennetsu str. Miyayama]
MRLKLLVAPYLKEIKFLTFADKKDFSYLFQDVELRFNAGFSETYPCLPVEVVRGLFLMYNVPVCT